ncbi:unnamed protein product [Clonostachys rosea]|uniref:Uncharacterized protein n=1 Tax=Bionectria ochroleuca TaxID=29856 RepID=A0ABY6U3Z5_BIOOC|nr:unnamed protein product [Clonostachys rosea]
MSIAMNSKYISEGYCLIDLGEESYLTYTDEAGMRSFAKNGVRSQNVILDVAVKAEKRTVPQSSSYTPLTELRNRLDSDLIGSD